MKRTPHHVALVSLLTLVSCGQPARNGPLPDLAPDRVTAIEVKNEAGSTVSFTKPAEVRFVLRQFTLTEPRREGKVNPEFWVVVRPVMGPPVILRLDRRCVGPAVRASDVVTRWYFKNEALYSFITSALSRSKPVGSVSAAPSSVKAPIGVRVRSEENGAA